MKVSIIGLVGLTIAFFLNAYLSYFLGFGLHPAYAYVLGFIVGLITNRFNK